MCDTKAVSVSISINLLAAASFRKNKANTENKVGHHSEIRSQGPAKKSTRSSVWTAVDAIFKLIKIVWAVIAHSYIIENDVKVTCGMNKFEFKIKKDENLLIQKMTRRNFLFYTLTRCKILNSKADKTKKK